MKSTEKVSPMKSSAGSSRAIEATSSTLSRLMLRSATVIWIAAWRKVLVRVGPSISGVLGSSQTTGEHQTVDLEQLGGDQRECDQEYQRQADAEQQHPAPILLRQPRRERAH